MAGQLGISELLRRQLVTSEQINAAVAEYFAKPKVGHYRIADGIAVDIAAALRELGWIKAVAVDSILSGRGRHMAVRTAILLVGVTSAVSSSLALRSKARHYHPNEDCRG